MLAGSLKQAGYATGHFGKWHMGGQRDVADAQRSLSMVLINHLRILKEWAKLLPLTKNGDGKVGRIWVMLSVWGSR